jgi:hypothetical protein
MCIDTSAKDKSNDAKDSFYEELQHEFHQFPKYPMLIYYKVSIQKQGKKIFSNQQLGTHFT